MVTMMRSKIMKSESSVMRGLKRMVDTMSGLKRMVDTMVVTMMRTQIMKSESSLRKTMMVTMMSRSGYGEEVSARTWNDIVSLIRSNMEEIRTVVAASAAATSAASSAAVAAEASTSLAAAGRDEVQHFLGQCVQHLEKGETYQGPAVLGIAMVSMAEELGVEIAIRLLVSDSGQCYGYIKST